MTAAIQSRFTRCLTMAVCVLFLGISVVHAQINAALSGPVFGFVFDANRQKLRPLKGILGSATVGIPLELGFEASLILTLDASHVVLAADGSPELLAVNLEATPYSRTAISGVPVNPSQVVASLQGTSAAFYYADARQILIVTGLPENPAVSYRIDLARFGEAMTHMAVSNDGALLIVAATEVGTEAIYGWTASSNSFRFLLSAVSTSGMAVTGNGAAIVADRGGNEVFAVWDAAGAAVRQSLAGARDGVSSPAGVAVGNDNRIYIGNAGLATVMVLDSDGRFLRTLSCGCALTRVYPLRDSVFRLTDRIDQTIFLLDTSTAEERILFVPPAKD